MAAGFLTRVVGFECVPSEPVVGFFSYFMPWDTEWYIDGRRAQPQKDG